VHADHEVMRSYRTVDQYRKFGPADPELGQLNFLFLVFDEHSPFYPARSSSLCFQGCQLWYRAVYILFRRGSMNVKVIPSVRFMDCSFHWCRSTYGVP
jgi:hypothetical protein